MRSRRDEWGHLHPEDVVWVTEWQLASACRWLPLESERTVSASTAPEPDLRFWPITIRAGEALVPARLPLRDVAKLIEWCYSVESVYALTRPPAELRACMLGLRAALRSALRRVDPLQEMGYAGRGQGAAGG